jgi:hypothetical protein
MKSASTLAMAGSFLIAWAAGAGCAFDISHVALLPVNYAPETGAEVSGFVLLQDVTVKLGTGFPTHLKAASRWRMVGRTEFGDVYATADQILTVEASNIYEAQMVVADHNIPGVYLPVEKKFVQVSQPIRISTQPSAPVFGQPSSPPPTHPSTPAPIIST